MYYSGMQINSIQASSYNRQNFDRMYLPLETQRTIIRSINKEQREDIQNAIYEQANNPVSVWFYNETPRRLGARVICPYFIKNFKEYYKQIPVFESNYRFVKRMEKRANDYRAILDAAETEQKKG